MIKRLFMLFLATCFCLFLISALPAKFGEVKELPPAIIQPWDNPYDVDPI